MTRTSGPLADPWNTPDDDIPFDLPAHTPRPGGIAARARAGAQPPGPVGRAPAYLDGLNPEQRAAVEATEGPVLVLAGAGTGKTRVLTTRIAHILSLGLAWPSQILAVTFTNKAAREMKDRIGAMVGEQVEGMPWLGTFHSIGVRMLRRHAELVGLKSGFTILDTDDQIRLLKQLLQAEQIDEKRWPARLLANTIDGWKNRGLTPDMVSAGEGAAFANGRGQKLYADYQARLKALNAVDFGDLLLESIRLLRENPDVLAEYHKRFRYLLVDEYQDTNVAQYLWLRLLAQGSHNVCCVGDDDQSIYGWRGAEVDNILRFESDFPGATVVRLERNYRSTGHILGAAAHLIAHNEGRLGKTLFSEGDSGEKVTVTGAWDSQEEARAIGEEIEALQHQGRSLSQMAILVRASFQMREFEDRFVTLGLNYRVIGGPRFYERAEIRDALAYLRVIASPADDLAFERIVNVPKRGLGDAALRQIHDHARAVGVPLVEAARQLVGSEELKPKVRLTLRDLVGSFDRWREQMGNLPQSQLAEIVLDESGYTEMWQKDRSADAAGRLENLKELVRSMEPFENLVGFLEHISLVMDAEGSGAGDAVSIMTLHSAKGLEFDVVFLPGWEEGLFPHQRALDEQGRAGLEEERRLAYVGITRARRFAKVFFASNRRIHGMWQSSVPSRFLDELPEAHVEVTESRGGHGWGGATSAGRYGYGPSRFDEAQTFGSTYSTPGWQRAQSHAQANASANAGTQNSRREGQFGGFSEGASRYSPGASRGGGRIIEGQLVASSTGAPSRFPVGTRVFHQKFGYGEVTAAEGNKLTVQFDKAGEKRVLDTYVEGV
ncbi:UvrD-helicase domain-containing protein [Ancylobacter sp. Lp-2]|uniref:ATP-dependent helicase n=1 Tax=Ancylobacter sp. Lp-2 TaxID=2881339 RepID=UPI001E36DA77|nr:UvrD-helicase domain-containing protein [Ancylobacter sp. Lp-2]MCB4770875.1 UvrD-helicase domain-containing protein [Ancylobacter sp. Lp-2]